MASKRIVSFKNEVDAESANIEPKIMSKDDLALQDHENGNSPYTVIKSGSRSASDNDRNSQRGGTPLDNLSEPGSCPTTNDKRFRMNKNRSGTNLRHRKKKGSAADDAYFHMRDRMNRNGKA